MEVQEIPENLAMNNQIFFAQRQQSVIGKNNLTCKTEIIRPTVKWFGFLHLRYWRRFLIRSYKLWTNSITVLVWWGVLKPWTVNLRITRKHSNAFSIVAPTISALPVSIYIIKKRKKKEKKKVRSVLHKNLIGNGYLLQKRLTQMTIKGVNIAVHFGTQILERASITCQSFWGKRFCHMM